MRDSNPPITADMNSLLTIRSLNTSTVRSVNQRIILDKIYEKQIASRTELSRDLKISKPAIADNLDALLAVGIVQEYGEGEVAKSGGRKPRLIRFNKNFKNIIAIDLNFKDPIFVLGNLKGEIFNEFSIKISEQANAQVRIDLIKNAIHILLNSRDAKVDSLACIAISSPGVFHDKKELSFANPQFKEWFDLDLPKLISEEFKVNVLLKNDVNMAAYGELCYGSGKNSRNILYISCGRGVGAGLILDSKLYEGHYHSAGEIFNNIDPVKLNNKSNLEKTIYLDTLIKKSQDIIKKKTTSSFTEEISDFDRIVKAYQENNPYLLKLLDDIGTELGCTITNIVNLLSIDTVIIGGEYIVFYKTLYERIIKIMNEHCIFSPAIYPSKLGRYAGIMGLFAISREHYFDSLIRSL